MSSSYFERRVLKEIIIAQYESFANFSRANGISYFALARCINGYSKPRVKFMEKVAAALNHDPASLFPEYEEEKRIRAGAA